LGCAFAQSAWDGRALNFDGGDGVDTYTDAGGSANVLKLNSVELIV
jgi:hypothetical protein